MSESRWAQHRAGSADQSVGTAPLADPELPPPRRKGIMSLHEDFGGAPLLVAVVSRPGVEPIEKTENPLSAAAAVQNMSLAA